MPPIYHIYNRANDREILFLENQNYDFFLQKMQRSLFPAARLLGYCIMPNHFHVVVLPTTATRKDIIWSDKPIRKMPTYALSKAMNSWLMGFTKSYNSYYQLTGSRFQQHSQVTRHDQLDALLSYVHENPVKANLVSDPVDWWYSSAAEYASLIPSEDCLADVELGRRLVMQ